MKLHGIIRYVVKNGFCILYTHASYSSRVLIYDYNDFISIKSLQNTIVFGDDYAA